MRSRGLPDDDDDASCCMSVDSIAISGCTSVSSLRGDNNSGKRGRRRRVSEAEIDKENSKVGLFVYVKYIMVM